MNGLKIPSKDYRRQYQKLLPEMMPMLERILLEEHPVLGPSVERFEQQFAAMVGVEHAVGVGSGTDALILSLRALGVGEGAEVVTAANTFIATISAIALTGAIPVLVDPDPRTMNLTAQGLEQAITKRTAAVIPVHLYGRMAPMEDITQVASDHGLIVLEDAAQAHGARDINGRRAGSHGHAGCFSFHPSKNLGAFGDGGAVTTADAALAQALRQLRNLGKVGKYEVRRVSGNSRLDTLQAAILSLKLNYLHGWNSRRREIGNIYRDKLRGVGDLLLLDEEPGTIHAHHLFVICTGRREELLQHLRDSGIQASLHYPIAPHQQRLDRDFGWKPGDYPVTEELCRTVLSLPIAPELSDTEILEVCRAVRQFFGDAS